MTFVRFIFHHSTARNIFTDGPEKNYYAGEAGIKERIVEQPPLLGFKSPTPNQLSEVGTWLS